MANDVMEIMNQAALNISAISEQMGVVAGQLKKLNSGHIDHENRISDIENWTKHHDDTDRVSRDKARRIKKAVNERVRYLLGINYEDGLVSKECMAIDKNYRSAFMRKCYNDARRYSDLAERYDDTCNKDYESVIKYIHDWEPECQYEGKTGTSAYMSYLDDRRNA